MNETDALSLAPLRRIEGVLRPPGDKSIGHRALLLSALADGRSTVAGLPQGADVRSTAATLRALGASIDTDGDAATVIGRGFAGLDQSDPRALLDLDCGNSGTTARLLLGLLSGRRGSFRLDGDASLRGRPMRRVTRPLAAFGADCEDRGTLPLIVSGRRLHAASVATGVASAQVKSALILAALQAEGESTIHEAEPTRDHSERMLRAAGVPLRSDPTPDGGADIVLRGPIPSLTARHWEVPGDPSSAAFFVALAALLPGSDLRVEGLLLNPRRLGFYRLLQRMGADLSWRVETTDPEPSGSLHVLGGPGLSGIEVGPAEVADGIDELPILAVVAARAVGPTTITGAGELRVKESDRIAATARLLRAFGAAAEERPDGLIIGGRGRWQGASFAAGGDHRLAMAAAIASATAHGTSSIAGTACVGISYPEFFAELSRLGVA